MSERETAIETLRRAPADDTTIVAAINGERMIMHTATPRGPSELVHIARRLLEEARDQYVAACDGRSSSEDDAEYMADCLCAALAELPKEEDDDAEDAA